MYQVLAKIYVRFFYYGITLTITRLIDVGVLLVAFPNDSFSLRFTDCLKIGGNKKDIGSALADHVQTCLFIYDSLSFIYY